MRKKDVQKIGDIVNELLYNDKKLNSGIVNSRVIQNWSTIMGPTISRNTKNVFLAKNGVLFVSLTSSVVRNELMLLKDKIIKNLNDSVGNDVVRDIVFK